MSDPRANKPQKRYTVEEKHAALELAAAVGRRAAIRQLGISPHSLQNWIEDYPELWSDLRAGDREAQKHGFAQRLEDLAEQYSVLEFEALQRAERLIKTADPKELAALIKAMGASRGVAAVGARSLRGEDAEHVEIDINFPQIEKAAEAILATVGPPPALPVANVAEADAAEDSERNPGGPSGAE